MVKMPNCKGKNMNYKKIVNAKTDHGQGQVFYSSIGYCFHPMIPQMGSKTHLSNAMMDFMILP